MPDYFTHGIVALHNRNDPAYVAGNIFTDLGILLNLKEGVIDLNHGNMVRFADYLKEKRYSQSFIDGMLDHIKVDAYGHAKYIIPKASILSQNIRTVDVHVAHAMVEFAHARKLLFSHPQEIRIIREATYDQAQKEKLRIHLQKFFGRVNTKRMLDDCLNIVMKNNFTPLSLFKSAMAIRHYVNQKFTLAWWPGARLAKPTLRMMDALTQDHLSFVEDMAQNALSPLAVVEPVQMMPAQMEPVRIGPMQFGAA